MLAVLGGLLGCLFGFVGFFNGFDDGFGVKFSSGGFGFLSDGFSFGDGVFVGFSPSFYGLSLDSFGSDFGKPSSEIPKGKIFLATVRPMNFRTLCGRLLVSGKKQFAFWVFGRGKVRRLTRLRAECFFLRRKWLFVLSLSLQTQAVFGPGFSHF